MRIRDPDDVDAIPDEFFQRKVPATHGPLIREQSIRTRIATLAARVGAN
jgi:hypothetical protein